MFNNRSVFFDSTGEIVDDNIYTERGMRYTNYSDTKSNSVPLLYRKQSDCCGCTACYTVCPVEAITMVEEVTGFLYPVIDLSKCVQCHACIRVCDFQK